MMQRFSKEVFDEVKLEMIDKFRSLSDDVLDWQEGTRCCTSLSHKVWNVKLDAEISDTNHISHDLVAVFSPLTLTLTV